MNPLVKFLLKFIFLMVPAFTATAYFLTSAWFLELTGLKKNGSLFAGLFFFAAALLVRLIHQDDLNALISKTKKEPRP